MQPLIRQLIARGIRSQRQQTRDDETLFQELVDARDTDGQWLSDAEIEDHIFTMLIAGVDPSAIALAWGLYWIHQTPGILEKLAAELATLDPEPDPKTILALPYLEVVCQEALRMYPVVATPSGRKLLSAVDIQGQTYEPGLTLLPCTYLVHHRADLYPEPHKFQPERFFQRRYAPYEYLPFGGGNRLCIGGPLAQVEMKMALATILRHRQLALANQGPITPLRHGTLLAPSDNLQVVVTPRS
jgi:cytochrome P450